MKAILHSLNSRLLSNGSSSFTSKQYKEVDPLHFFFVLTKFRSRIYYNLKIKESISSKFKIVIRCFRNEKKNEIMRRARKKL